MCINEKFDYLGIPVFLFFTVDALLELKRTEKPGWNIYGRLVLGICGLLIDTFLVFFA